MSKMSSRTELKELGSSTAIGDVYPTRILILTMLMLRLWVPFPATLSYQCLLGYYQQSVELDQQM
ncbi:unnamed protein product [Mortierella alpina]